MRRPKNILLRCAAVLAAGLGFAFATVGPAGAAGPQPVSPTELSKATTAARSAGALSLLGKAGGTAKAATTVARDTYPIYALNPAFVRDASAPVATFWYAATTATAGGRTMTVFTTPDAKGGWQAVNVASGNTEARMASAADGATVFTEPQLGAWYALSATQVRPLNASAIKSIGSKPISVTAYQDLVSGRYSDKLPGSSYNDAGMAGGYSDSAQVPVRAVVRATSDIHVLPIAAAGVGLTIALVLLIRRRTLRTR
ncbi:hypothetical protein [Kribbella shirazensis]|uniref:Uncharacterized protein n=1 Tax=Kribbella shirazensis TaxID=1105143 RepID=A0A7X5VCG7_9ACTN|nr:hypothetical protein [Kribbella shirazensis]NIK58689.1 hypothetical protein [Kribbella shirazensis]